MAQTTAFAMPTSIDPQPNDTSAVLSTRRATAQAAREALATARAGFQAAYQTALRGNDTAGALAARSNVAILDDQDAILHQAIAAVDAAMPGQMDAERAAAIKTALVDRHAAAVARCASIGQRIPKEVVPAMETIVTVLRDEQAAAAEVRALSLAVHAAGLGADPDLPPVELPMRAAFPGASRGTVLVEHVVLPSVFALAIGRAGAWIHGGLVRASDSFGTARGTFVAGDLQMIPPDAAAVAAAGAAAAAREQLADRAASMRRGELLVQQAVDKYTTQAMATPGDADLFKLALAELQRQVRNAEQQGVLPDLSNVPVPVPNLANNRFVPSVALQRLAPGASEVQLAIANLVGPVAAPLWTKWAAAAQLLKATFAAGADAIDEQLRQQTPAAA